jgi:hypothetical protein
VPDGDSAVQVLAAGLKRYTSLSKPAAGGEGGAHVRHHEQGRAPSGGRRLVAAGQAMAAGRSQAYQARPSCMLGADPGRAPRLPGEAEGQNAEAGAGGSRIALRLRLAASHQACNIAVLSCSHYEFICRKKA